VDPFLCSGWWSQLVLWYAQKRLSSRGSGVAHFLGGPVQNPLRHVIAGSTLASTRTPVVLFDHNVDAAGVRKRSYLQHCDV
jgi:hypothetical protein